MRNVAGLVRRGKRVYVYLKSKELCRRFYRDAEAEGFRFGDGISPTKKDTDNIIRLYDDWTMSYVGMWGHMAFVGIKYQKTKDTIRIDYARYIAGERHYIMNRKDVEAGRKKH